METYIYPLSALILGILVKFFYDSLKKGPVETPEHSPQVEILRNLVEKIDLITTPNQPETPVSVLERLEELERRFEKLHKDSLRYLQQGNQSWKRIQERQESEEMGQAELEDQAAQIMDGGNSVPDPESDLEWAKQAMRARGETPII
jgi:hypothetical protein